MEDPRIARLIKAHQAEIAQIRREFQMRLSAALTEATRAKADADRYWQAWQQAVNPEKANESG